MSEDLPLTCLSCDFHDHLAVTEKVRKLVTVTRY